MKHSTTSGWDGILGAVKGEGMKSLKALQIAVEHTQREVRTCKVTACQEATREGKVFCTDHIEFQPYVRDLIQRMTLRNQEDVSVLEEGSSAVNLKGITVQEILLHLRQSGSRTEERLEREVQLDRAIIHNYLVRLSMEGIIRFGRTARNNICVSLIDFDPTQLIEENDD